MKRILILLAGWLLSVNSLGAIDLLDNHGVRIKDIAQVEGARPNQLRGLGIVTGLQDTGDGNDDSVSALMMRNLLRNFDLIPSNTLTDLSKNTAAVMVTAEIPAFAKPGTKIDVTVSSIGAADSLQGGVLLQSPLKGADGQVYAVAQGPITTGTFTFKGNAARVIQGTSGNVGTISQGAIVEAEVPVNMLRGRYLYLNLHHPDFTTAVRVADAINAQPIFKDHIPLKPASPIGASSVQIRVPESYQDDAGLVRLITEVEKMYVEPDQVARIVVNERTGTIVIGQHVRISTVAVAHGGLSVAIVEEAQVSQPGAFAQAGTTEQVERTGVNAEEAQPETHVLKGEVTVSELAHALNALGATSRDIIAILQAIKAAGALQAELVIM